MKFDQKTPVLLPVTGKAAEGFKRLLEKPSNPPRSTYRRTNPRNF